MVAVPNLTAIAIQWDEVSDIGRNDTKAARSRSSLAVTGFLVDPFYGHDVTVALLASTTRSIFTSAVTAADTCCATSRALVRAGKSSG